MKKTLLFLFVIMLGVSAYAQEKLFTEAIRRGTTANGYYCAENTNKRVITEKEMRDYANKKGYYVGRVACIDIQKFGDTKRIVYKFEFAPPENTINIIFNQLNSSSVTSSQLRSRGTAICLIKTDLKNSGWPFLTTIDNLLWSGTNVDGFINGTGTGFVHRHGTDYVYIQGTFSRGIPSGKVIVKNLPDRFVSGTKIDHSRIRAIESNAMTIADINKWYESGHIKNDEKMKSAVRHHLQELYSSNYEKMKKAYEKALTITAANYKSFVQDDEANLCCNVYKTFNYDPKGILPKATEMQEVYQILDGLNFKFHKYYYEAYGAHWDEGRLNNDRRTLNDRINLAKKRATDSKYGFKRFHSMAISKLEKVLSDINEKGKSDYSSYLALKAKEKREHAHYSGGGGWSSGGSSDDERYRSTVENLGMPEYTIVKDWHDVISSTMNKGAEQTKFIIFSDTQEEAKLGRAKSSSGKYFYKVHSTNADYYTESDAIIAAYAYQKYKLIRQKGEWK